MQSAPEAIFCEYIAASVRSASVLDKLKLLFQHKLDVNKSGWIEEDDIIYHLREQGLAMEFDKVRKFALRWLRMVRLADDDADTPAGSPMARYPLSFDEFADWTVRRALLCPLLDARLKICRADLRPREVVKDVLVRTVAEGPIPELPPIPSAGSLLFLRAQAVTRQATGFLQDMLPGSSMCDAYQVFSLAWRECEQSEAQRRFSLQFLRTVRAGNLTVPTPPQADGEETPTFEFVADAAIWKIVSVLSSPHPVQSRTSGEDNPPPADVSIYATADGTAEMLEARAKRFIRALWRMLVRPCVSSKYKADDPSQPTEPGLSTLTRRIPAEAKVAEAVPSRLLAALAPADVARCPAVFADPYKWTFGGGFVTNHRLVLPAFLKEAAVGAGAPVAVETEQTPFADLALDVEESLYSCVHGDQTADVQQTTVTLFRAMPAAPAPVADALADSGMGPLLPIVAFHMLKTCCGARPLLPAFPETLGFRASPTGPSDAVLVRHAAGWDTVVLPAVGAPFPRNTGQSMRLPVMRPASMSGWLWKEGHTRKNWKRRFFRLEDGVLEYYESDTATKPKKSVDVRDVADVRTFPEDRKLQLKHGIDPNAVKPRTPHLAFLVRQKSGWVLLAEGALRADAVEWVVAIEAWKRYLVPSP